MSSTFTLVCAIALVALIVYYLSRGESGKAIRTGETWLIMFGAMKLAGLTGAICTACMISAAAPSATNTVMMTVKYDRDAGVASKQIAFCTMLCVLTMPVMIALSKAVGV